ncbi:hypothetical protein [Dactylosporangium sp. NPDC049140]
MPHDTILVEFGVVILALGLPGAVSLRFSISPPAGSRRGGPGWR